MNAVRIPILMYHRVGEAHNAWERKYCVSPERFFSHMQALGTAGWQAVSMEDFFQWLDSSIELPEKSLLLTFDDGFKGVYEHAAPALEAQGWPATVFLVSQLIGQRDTWCEAHNPDGVTYPLMGADHIRELRGRGFRFHSHTRTHADLRETEGVALHDELAGSRSDLEQLLGESVDYVAYPYGNYDDRVLRATEAAGYRAAFSVQPGFNRRGMDCFRLRRLDVFGTDSPAALVRKVTLGSNDGSLAHSLRYYVGRALATLGMTN